MPAPSRVKFTLLVAIVVLVALTGKVFTQVAVQPVNDLPNPYETVPNWGMLPEGRIWGSTSAVNVDRDGRSIWVAERCGTNPARGRIAGCAQARCVRQGRRALAQDVRLPRGIHVDRR